MKLGRERVRERIRRRLTEGAASVRITEARRVLPRIAGALHQIRDEKAAAMARFNALREAAGESSGGPATTSLPTINPVLQRKSRNYLIWGPVLLIPEAVLASYAASLTITGGWMLHLLVGAMATLLFCGIAKLGVSTQLDSGRLDASIEKFERQLRWLVAATAVMLAIFFVARFFPAAEEIFALTSTLLSFFVAYIVGLCLALGDILGAANREITRYRKLAWLEAEIDRLAKQAEQVLDDSDTESLPAKRSKGGLTAAGIALLLLLSASPSEAADAAQSLTLYIDVSGSVSAEEFARIRSMLEDPLPMIEEGQITRLAIVPFHAEIDALRGPPHSWQLPLLEVPECTVEDSLFTATRKTREAECATLQNEARNRWRRKVATTLDAYRNALTAVDATAAKDQTCLYPILDRAAASAELSVIITDGGHTNCGPPPDEIRDGTATIILVPDSDGPGIADRMGERTSLLARLYPAMTILPSWQVQPETLRGTLLQESSSPRPTP